MNPLLGYGLISSIGSLGASLFNTFTGQKQSKDLMDYQYQLQQEAIDKQNFYNSPAEQMKRLAEANLNPNLVYGNGVDGNQSSAASPSMSSRSGQMQNPLQDLGQAYLESKQLQMQEIANRNAAFESRARIKNLEAKTLGILSDNKLKDATLNTNIKLAAQKLANETAREGILEQTANNMRIQANVLVETADNLAARTGLAQEQALTEVVRREAIRKGMSLTQKQIEQASSYIEFLRAGTALRRQGLDIQKTAYDAQKVWDEWKAKHPTATLTLNMVKEILGMAESVAKVGAAFIP